MARLRRARSFLFQGRRSSGLHAEYLYFDGNDLAVLKVVHCTLYRVNAAMLRLSLEVL